MTIGNPHGYPDYTWPMVWVLQDAELWPIEQWAAHVGVEKLWRISIYVSAGATQVTVVYTVPAGKKLYLARFVPSATQQGGHVLSYEAPLIYIYDLFMQAYTAEVCAIVPPGVLVAGKLLEVRQHNYGVVDGYFNATLQAFELDV